MPAPDPPLPSAFPTAPPRSTEVPFAPLGWRRSLEVARTVYDEFAFQSIYPLKLGNVGLEHEDKPGQSVEKARTQVRRSKAMVAFLMFTTIAGGGVFLSPGGRATFGLTLAPLEYTASLLAGVLLLVFSLLWMTGLQLAPTFLGSRTFPLLQTLPLSKRDMERIGLILFVRMFDLPAGVAILWLPVMTALSTQNVGAGLLMLPATIFTILFACSVSLATSKFFVHRVSAARGGTVGSLAVRWGYLLLWSLPSLAITALVSFSTTILNQLSLWELNNPGAFRTLSLVFPFPFTYVASYVVYPAQDVDQLVQSPLLWSSLLLYSALAVVCAFWLRTAPAKLAMVNPMSSRAVGPLGSDLRVNSPTRAILHKDLRIASRNPGYAFLIILPLLDAFILGLSTFVAAPNPTDAQRFAIAAVVVAALLATFFGPAFFATEVLGFSFTRTLPLTRRTLLLGKASLIFIIYVLASVLVMALVAERIGQPFLFAVFALGELPAVLAAAFLELGVLFHRAERTGIPVAALYSGAWWATLVVVPGLLVAGAPLALYALGQIYDKTLAVPSMIVASVVLLSLTFSWALWGERGAAAAA